MSRIAKAFLSSLFAGVILLALFFFVVPWLLLVLVMVGIAVFASVFLGRGRIDITTVRITNTPHGNLIKTVKMVSPTMEHQAGWDGEIRERISDADIIIYPNGSDSDTAPEDDSFEIAKG